MAVTRRGFAIGGLSAAAAVAPFTYASADDYPSRPVQLIVPYAPGGSGDLLARLLGNQLSKLWGQQVVIENKAGAGGLIGTEAAAKSAADGYTLYLATDGPLTIAATLHRHLPYDWKRDFAPISMMAVGYQILLASPKLPASNLKDFIALAKQNPGKYNFASIGVGSAPHLAAELFLSMAGLKLTHVPYPGSSQQCIAALISGDVAMFMVGISTAVPFVKAGTVRGLAVTAPKRVDSLPDVPTFAEWACRKWTTACGSPSRRRAARRRRSSRKCTTTWPRSRPIPRTKRRSTSAASRRNRIRPSNWRRSWRAIICR